MSSLALAIDASESSPFRILGPNANPSDPSFQDVMFDGNQMPLRVKQKGTIYVNVSPGFYDGAGKYGGVSTPISSPNGTKRHLVLGNGWLATTDGSLRQLPGQKGATETVQVLGAYFRQSGIGVGTDLTKVWGLNMYSGNPIFTVDGYIDIGNGQQLPNYVVSGWEYVNVYVSYMVLQNTIG